ncbi:MAG: DUF4032 domain-containing protein [Acidimicrobiales bacterium]
MAAGSDLDFAIVTRGGHPDFLDLPWGTPLEEWDHHRMIQMAHGISRHIVRFVRYDDRVYALKETGSHAAEHEYRALRELRDEHLPVVEPVGVVTIGGAAPGAVLVTRYLDYSLPYWYVIGREQRPESSNVLLDAGVVLLVRLHLAGVFWGDCSLSNTLFRRDAGAMMAYLVDAETTERQPSISDQLRERDIEIAYENVAGGLLDLQASGRVPAAVDPIELADELRRRYHGLWEELTRTDEIDSVERWRIDQRVRRVNDMGFDVEELVIGSTSAGSRLRITPTIIEEGHHSRELRRRTGLEVQENQARRLLADIESFRAWMERHEDRPVPAAVAAARWLADVYEPIIEAVPDDLRSRLEPAEFFHQLLEHRYLMAERAGAEVTNPDALEDFLQTILPEHPAEQQLLGLTAPDVGGPEPTLTGWP